MGTPSEHYIMPQKKVKPVVVLKNKQVREVVQMDLDQGHPAKRTRSLEADPEIVMTITQLVATKTKNKKDKPGLNLT